MVEFKFVVVSGQEDYDYMENVIEVVEQTSGIEVEMGVMEKVVSDLIKSNGILSGVSRVEGTIKMLDFKVKSEYHYLDNMRTCNFNDVDVKELQTTIDYVES
jgi:hypothetical protein